ncbi:annexin A13-like [Patiria miniata]|uniref:Annexin n=1 Tax=Patiria miniata TaxID=46514 RepID=A0A913ZIQ6_PATMI|nr:annexin A13-like [Patiria miniata]
MATPTKGGKVPPGQLKKIEGTIKPAEPFDMQADVAKLQKLLCSRPCEEALADLLTSRSSAQRQEIKQGYKAAAGKELMDDINKVLSSSKFKDVVVGLVDDSLQFAARCLYQAMKGMGTDEKALVDVLCTRARNVETTAIKETFQEMFGSGVEAMLKEETSEPFLKLLLTTAAATREEVPSADIETQAKADADALIKAGEGRTSGPRDDAKFIEILATRSLIQLNLATFKYYDQKSKKGGIEKYLASEKGDEVDGYMALVKTAKGELIQFYVDRLYAAMKGLGTDDNLIIRTLISRSEIDLANIKQEFQAKYGTTLENFIKDDTSGDYCYILLRILAGGPPAKA